MEKTTAGVTQVTFMLSEKELKKAIENAIEDRGQILGYTDDTIFSFKDGGCTVVTMHYGLKKDIKTETLKGN